MTRGEAVVRRDYVPFREEITAGYGRDTRWEIADGISQKFTGQERDSETQLDFFQARYFSAAQGRFNSVDPANAGADLLNPQSWNGYAYVNNNPLNATDPTGMFELKPQDPWAPGGSLFQLWWDSLWRRNGDDGGSQQARPEPPVKFSVTVTANPPKTGNCSSSAGSNARSAWSEMFSALGSWLTSGPKYIHYGPSDPYTKDFMNSSTMLYLNNSISGSQASSGRVAVGTGRAFLFTVLDALGGSPSISEAQFGAFVATYSRNGSGTDINISNDISNNSALYHIPSGLSMSGSYADRFGRLTGHVPTGAVLQEMTIHQCP